MGIDNFAAEATSKECQFCQKADLSITMRTDIDYHCVADVYDVIEGGKVVVPAKVSGALMAASPRFLKALRDIVKMASETHDHWDNDRDSKVGKHLGALAGWMPGYRDDTDAIHALLKEFPELEAPIVP